MDISDLNPRASRIRLTKLIEERLQPGADKKEIDRRIWTLFGETWTVMFTDLSGFSRQVAEFGIIHFLQIIVESERIFTPVIEGNDGILLKMEGDSMLVLFRDVRKSIRCAIQMQEAVKEFNKTKSSTEQLLLCVGLGYGKMLRIGDEDVFGAEVNAASKLGEDTAKAWEIMVTDSVKKAAGKIPGVTFRKIAYKPPGATGAYQVIYPLNKG